MRGIDHLKRLTSTSFLFRLNWSEFAAAACVTNPVSGSLSLPLKQSPTCADNRRTYGSSSYSGVIRRFYKHADVAACKQHEVRTCSHRTLQITRLSAVETRQLLFMKLNTK